MAGPIRSLSRTFVDVSGDGFHRDCHYTLVKYFEEHPGFQRLACNYGVSSNISGSGLSGSLYAQGRSENNAFAVFRAVSASLAYDVAVVWTQNVSYAANSWTAGTTYYFGVALAYHVSGAWSGSINNNGTDRITTASQPWRSGSVVFPRSNSDAGSYVTNKNAVMKPAAIATTGTPQMFVVGDNDVTYFWMTDASAKLDGGATSVAGFGTYVPVTSSYTLPLFAFAGGHLNTTNTYGSTTATELTNLPGGVSYTVQNDVRTLQLHYPVYAPIPAQRPPSQISGELTSFTWGFPISVSSYEANHYHLLGHLSGVYVGPTNTFGNMQDISQSCVTMKISNSPSSLSLLMPSSGTTIFYQDGPFS